MDFVAALNVTIYGLGIVFLALLVVMFVIMLLSRLFAAATGRDFLAAPVVAEVSPPEAVQTAPAPPPGVALRVTPAPVTVAHRAPAPAIAQPLPPSNTSGVRVTAPLPGKVLSIAVKSGQAISRGDELCVIEAMKMANSIKAQREGTIREILVTVGDSVPFGAPLFEVR